METKDVHVVYVSKYAASGLVFAIRANFENWMGNQWATTVNKSNRKSFRMGTEAFLDYESACADAKKRREKRVRSLKKQVQKIEGFEEPSQAPEPKD